MRKACVYVTPSPHTTNYGTKGWRDLFQYKKENNYKNIKLKESNESERNEK